MSAALVRRAIRLARAAADAGHAPAARQAWLLAGRFAYRCGGISGTITTDGYNFIVLKDGLVAASPVPVVERRAG
jgi:hypothetical protein